jgi:lysozyme
MEFSQQGLDFLKRREALRLTSYKDSAGIWTIGYGTIRIHGRPVTAGMTCTQEQAEEYLREDVADTVESVAKSLHGLPITQNQFDSLVSFTYNVGSGGFLTSTLLKMIRAGQPVVQDYFTRWSKVRDPRTKQLVVSRGLYARRVMEFRMFTLGVYE